jgi:hypothetical protein
MKDKTAKAEPIGVETMAKKPYKTPTVRTYGDIQQITRGSTLGPVRDAVGPGKTGI